MSDQTCPHPRETWEREPALYSSICPECKARVCYDCRRHGSRHGGLPLVSWMTGTCDACYSAREQRSKVRGQFNDERESRLDRQRVWQAGRDSAADATNPYDAPTHWEKRLLEQHDWLREEAQP